LNTVGLHLSHLFKTHGAKAQLKDEKEENKDQNPETKDEDASFFSV
jgi:hypothetical protein